MTTTMQPLRDEHAALQPEIETLRFAGDRVGTATPGVMHELLDEIYEFLIGHMLPHALAEDEILYPAVERAMHAPGATTTMRRDHVEIGHMIEYLGAFRAHLTRTHEIDESSLRRVLYGLHALLRLHFAKEEEIYVPILANALSEDEASRLFAEMAAAARRAREHTLERLHPGSRALGA